MPTNLATPAPPRWRELRASDGFGPLYATDRQAACNLCDAHTYWRSEPRGLDTPDSRSSALPAIDGGRPTASVGSMLP
jgi:hypothetical protein